MDYDCFIKDFFKVKRGLGGELRVLSLLIYFFSKVARLFLSFNFFKLTKVFREGFSVLTVGVNFCERGVNWLALGC
jgi:hypothetical protein